MKLKDKTAIVTGAASGMGRAIAKRFAEEGANLVVADINDAGGRKTVEDIISGNRKAVFVHTDVSQSAEVKNMVDTAVRTFSKVDIMVNNAGIFMKMAPVEEIDESVWDRIYAINVKGIFNGARYVIPVMKQAGNGVIINTSSMTGHRPGAMMSAYASSKAAAIALTKSMAGELVPYNIRVNCICPGLTETPMIVHSELWEQVSVTPQAFGRLLSPQDIAAAALYLASDDAAMVTGLCLDVSGGQGV